MKNEKCWWLNSFIMKNFFYFEKVSEWPLILFYFILFFKNKRYNQKIKILMNSCQKIRETCVLMRPFDKYIFFGTQLYEIWKPAFNMKNYIFFMHSKLVAFFVSRLPFFFPPVPTICLSLPPQWNQPIGVITDRQAKVMFFSLAQKSWI